MATSSFSKKFVIEDPKAVEQLIRAMENPVKIKLKPQREESEAERKEFLCKLQQHIRSLNF